ncbi:ATP-binding protein [Roseobacter weihaiensis]|uniref:ATP-binding protein n=1 Tax=Roseobacter weihaiensis TaxID=2763262 RepID=UPI001D0B2464|nr:ATP-binding protein [Roseobacter sp. H9]
MRKAALAHVLYGLTAPVIQGLIGFGPGLVAHHLTGVLRRRRRPDVDHGRIQFGYAGRIFEPMQRLHTQDEIEGSELGLAMCKRIATTHSGDVQLEDSYHEGGRFIVRLSKSLKG